MNPRHPNSVFCAPMAPSALWFCAIRNYQSEISNENGAEFLTKVVHPAGFQKLGSGVQDGERFQPNAASCRLVPRISIGGRVGHRILRFFVAIPLRSLRPLWSSHPPIEPLTELLKRSLLAV